MSSGRRRRYDAWRELCNSITVAQPTWRGNPLSRRDQATWTESMFMWYLVACDLHLHSEADSDLDLRTWLWTVSNADTDILAHLLSDLVVLLRQSSVTDDRISTSIRESFQRILADESLARFIMPIVDTLEVYLDSPSAHLFTTLNQFLSFPTHLTLVDIGLDADLEVEYLEQDARTGSHTAPQWLVDDIRRIITEWLRDLKINEESFIPKHGPGGIAEVAGDTSIGMKSLHLKEDQLLEYVFRHHMGVSVSSYFPIDNVGATSRRSAIVFVPKSMKTKRIISKEPATLMYFQKGLERILVDYIHHHPSLSLHIDLRDQSKMQDIARRASLSQSHGTIDLSAASDSISWSLVKEVFHDTPIYPYLVAVRSRQTVLPSGTIVNPLQKYAPMGSALTFPIQTLLFSAIVESGLRFIDMTTCNGRRPDTGGAGGGRNTYRVYGDDIIVPSHCFDETVLRLELLGFRVNEAKSFDASYRFKESCGCEAFDGIDVTPLKISRRFAARRVTSRTPSVFDGLIDMANSAYQSSLHSLRSYIVNKLIHDAHFPPFFSGSVDRGVYSPSPTNFGRPTKWNPDWQVQEVLCAKSTSKCRYLPRTWASAPVTSCDISTKKLVSVDDTIERIRLFEWLRRACERGDAQLVHPDQRLTVNVGSTASRLDKAWFVAEPVETDAPTEKSRS